MTFNISDFYLLDISGFNKAIVMATSKSTNLYNRQNWEDSDFPILCHTCLGDNPYIRMTKEKFGKECKICARPFTVFRWCPGARMRFKKTEVCQTCCKLKNICQTCLLDLEYGLPVQVRDSALKISDDLARGDVNKEYQLQAVERELAATDGTVAAGALGKAQPPSEMLLKLARTTPYYKRNRPHICSFWVKGECRRGEECPYRHEKPTDPDDPLADQNIKDRYYGVNDPVANKLMQRYDALPKLTPPSDTAITTLYVGGVADLTEKDLKDYFYQFGEVRMVSIVPKQQCAFVQFTTRTAAEGAAESAFNKLIIKGHRLTIRWGKAQGGAGAKEEEAVATQQPPLQPVPGLPPRLDFFNLSEMPPMHLPPPFRGMPPRAPPPRLGFRPMPPPPGMAMFPPPPLGMMFAPIHYPSQDPTRMGAPQHPTE